jgi:hypothetical protein
MSTRVSNTDVYASQGVIPRRAVFQNPRGQGKYYALVHQTSTPFALDLWVSDNGTSGWSNTAEIESGNGDVDRTSDYALYEDTSGSQLVVHVVCSNKKSGTGQQEMNYARVRIADSDSTVTVGTQQQVSVAGSAADVQAATVCLDRNDRLIIAAIQLQKSKGKSYWNIACWGTSQSGAGADAPTWSHGQDGDMVPGMDPITGEAAANEDKNNLEVDCAGWPSGSWDGAVFAKHGLTGTSTTCDISSIDFQFSGSAFTWDSGGVRDALTGVTHSNNHLVSGIIDDQTTPEAHIIYGEKGSTTVDVLHKSRAAVSAFGSASTVIDTGTEQAIEYGLIAKDDANDKVYYFYHHGTGTIYEKNSDTATISFSSENSVDSDSPSDLPTGEEGAMSVSEIPLSDSFHLHWMLGTGGDFRYYEYATAAGGDVFFAASEASISSQVSALIRNVEIDSADASVSGSAAAKSVDRNAIASAASISGSTAAKSVDRNMNATEPSVSASVSVASIDRGLVIVAPSISGSAANAILDKVLASVAASLSGSAVAASVDRPIAAIDASVSGSTSVKSVDRNVVAAADSVSASVSVAAIDRGMVVIVPAVSGSAADITLDRLLASIAVSISDSSAATSVDRPISALTASVSGSAAALLIEVLFDGVIASVSGQTSSMIRTCGVISTAAAVSGQTSDASIDRNYAVTVTSLSSQVSDASVDRSYVTTAASISGSSAALSIEGQLLLEATMAAISGQASNVIRDRAIAAATAAVSGQASDMSRDVFVDGTIASISSQGSILSRVREVAATMAALSGATSLLDGGRAFTGSSAALSGSSAHLTGLSVFFTGTSVIISTVTGVLTVVPSIPITTDEIDLSPPHPVEESEEMIRWLYENFSRIQLITQPLDAGSGITGTFTTTDGKTVEVNNGIVVSIT